MRLLSFKKLTKLKLLKLNLRLNAQNKRKTYKPKFNFGCRNLKSHHKSLLTFIL